MTAQYDKDKDSYLWGEELIPRGQVLAAFGVEFDTAREIRHMLAVAHQEVHGTEPSHNDLHVWHLTYVQGKSLPECVFDAYAKRRH